MTEKPGFLTGWCANGPDGNHHLCRHIYAGREGITYTCTCPCHVPERMVRRVLRRKTQA